MIGFRRPDRGRAPVSSSPRRNRAAAGDAAAMTALRCALSRNTAVSPLSSISSARAFSFQEICNQIIVDDGFESPLGFARGVGAPVAEQIR
jgi:tetraacyldisaccharide-1-P 4'-kinase